MKKLILAGILSLFCLAPLGNAAQAHDYSGKSHNYKHKEYKKYNYGHAQKGHKHAQPEHAYKHKSQHKYNYAHKETYKHKTYKHDCREHYNKHSNGHYHKNDDSLEQIIFKFILKN